MKFEFKTGGISPGEITRLTLEMSEDKSTGAFSIFLGQVRDDQKKDKRVKGIYYTAYEDMAYRTGALLMQQVSEKFQLNSIMVLHSLGSVAAGELCLMVLTASSHRRDAIAACNELVEKIKEELPVWGKEIFENETVEWKVNQ